MKTMILSVLFIATFASTSQAFDQTGKTAGGATLGQVLPVGDNEFNKQADGALAYGAYVRHHINPNWGVEGAVTRQDYDKICTCTRSNIYDVLGFYRLKGAEDLTPVFGLGLGLVQNHQDENLHLGTKLRAGVEKAFNEKVAFGANLDYQMVSKMPGAKRGPIPSDIHTLVPKVEVTWYFGN